MRVRNASAEHIGLLTIDENREHTRWPCFSHPATMTCEQAHTFVTRKGLRSLQPARSPAQERPFPQPPTAA